MRRSLLTFVFAILATAAAQAPFQTFTSQHMGFSIALPPDWVTQASPDEAYLNAQPAAGTAQSGQVAIEVFVEPEWTSSLEQGIDEVIAEMRASLMPDLRVEARSEATIAGLPARVIDIRGTAQMTHDVTYRMVFVLHGQRGYALFLEALSDHVADYRSLFDQVLASFTLTDVPTAPRPAFAGPATPAGYPGSYASEQLTLTLEAVLPGVHYVGTLQHGEQRYQLTAQATSTGLSGSFESAGTHFAFSAALAGDVLTFVTDGATYTLIRTAVGPDPDPCNPLVPGSCSGSQPPPGGSATLEATFTHSGVVGQLAPDGLAAGQLAGEADAIAYHTYVIDVPAGIALLTIELDADIELYLAIKHGSEILSYAPRAQGGDWDYLDTSEVSPSVIVIERPAAGTWYIDVINALGTGRVGSYYLAVQATHGDGSLAPDPLATGFAAEVPDPCPLLSLVPAATTTGPPPIITSGTRLVYYSAAASIPGERTQLLLDEHGNWVDHATGQRWDEVDIPGAGGEGVIVAQVGYVDQQVAQLSERHYLRDGTSGLAMYTHSAGSVSHAGCAGTYWLHPRALANLPEMDQGGVRVVRTPYRLAEATFDSLRIHTTTAAGFTAYVYDLDTGLLLYFGSRTVGAGALTPQPGGTAAPGRGSTQLVNGWLLDAQQVDVPWQSAPTPSWLAQVQQLDYQGTHTTLMAGSPAVAFPLTYRLSAGSRGHDWLRARTDAVMYSFDGLPSGHEQSVVSYGPASIGGLWIAPQALAMLSQGQLIDRVEAIGCVTTVSAVSGDAVTISEVGPLHSIDYVYDLGSGVLIGTKTVQQVGTTQHVSELQLLDGPR